MRLIEENPFRVLGLPVDASEKEIVKRVSDLEIFAEMGKEKQYDSDLDYIAPMNRTPELIKEARQKIEQPKSKFYQSLWWFWPNNSVDELALDVLQDGDYKKALSLWHDAIKGESPTRNNISNFKNLGLLALWLSLKGDKISKDTFRNGLSFTGRFMQSEAFNVYQSSILEESSLYELDQSTGNFVNDLYSELDTSFNNGSAISQKKFLSYVEEFPAKAKKSIKESLINTPRHNIEKEIQQTKARRKENPSNAAKIGFALQEAVRGDVEKLKSILSKNDTDYQLVVDKLAEELLECSISYYNYHLDHNTNIDPGEDTLKCIKLADEFAEGQRIKSRIKDNLPTIQEWVNNKEERQKFKEVEEENNFILNKLEKIGSKQRLAISDAKDLVNSCKPKLRVLKQKLGSDNESYIGATNAVVNTALNIIIGVINENAPSYRGDPAAQGYIQVVKEAYPVMASMSELDMSGDVKKRYNENKRIISNTKSQINKSQGGCYVATMVYGDYDHPKVKLLRNYRDEVLTSSYAGRLFIKLYYKYSPGLVDRIKGYHRINNAIRFLLEKTLIKWIK